MLKPLSPITQTDNTLLTDTFKVTDIIDLYKCQLHMDVSRFFEKTKFIQLYKCLDTGYKFYYPQGLEGDGRFYEMLQDRLKDTYYHPWKFENQLAYDHLKAGDKVLDIGCGIGNFLLRAREKTSEVYGLELNKAAAEICRSRNLKVYNEFIEEHSFDHEGYYDMVVMFQVLEHVSDVEKFIRASLKVLKAGGKLLIGVPNSKPYFARYDKYCTLNLPPHHMGLWNVDVFYKFAKLFNISIQKVIYDCPGRLLVHTYLRAKHLAGIKSLPGKHSFMDKVKMLITSSIAFPETVISKLRFGLNGAHIAVLFQKNLSHQL